jgi:hypothetical protein
MGVHEVRAESACRTERRRRERDVEKRTGVAGTNWARADARQRGCAPNCNTRRSVTDRVRDDLTFDTESLERLDLLEDPDVTAPIAEEGRRREDQGACCRGWARLWVPGALGPGLGGFDWRCGHRSSGGTSPETRLTI